MVRTGTTIVEQFYEAGAGAEIMDKGGAGAENK